VRDLNTGMPFPRKRNCWPGCAPFGIVSFTRLPSSSGSSKVLPSVAWIKLTGIWQNKSAPSRSSTGCWLTLTNTYKSPGLAPAAPASPSFVRRIRVPSSTPAGMDTESFRVSGVLPWPRQSPHGSEIICPLPLQLWQARSTIKKPCCARTLPCPWQVVHVDGLVPFLAPEPEHVLHGVLRLSVICLSTPV